MGRRFAGHEAFFLVASILLGGCAAPEWEREAASGAGLACFRVVDADTGEPVAGARATLHWNPGGTQENATADSEGWVRIPLPRAGGEVGLPVVHVRAPGRAMATGILPDPLRFHEVRMRRPAARTVEVRDFQGRPVPGLPIVLASDCGPCPLAPRTVTGSDGIARWEGADPVWIPEVLDAASPGECVGGRESLEVLIPGSSSPDRMVVRKWTGSDGAGEGIVLDHEGKPVAGLEVWSFEIDFSRMVRTGPDGRFRVRGEAGVDGWNAGSIPFTFPPVGFRITVRLPPPGMEPVEPPSVPVEVAVSAPGPDPLRADLPVWVVSDVDGISGLGITDAEGWATVLVPPGPCTVVVGDGMGRFLRACTKTVAADGAEAVDVALVEKPRLPVRLDGFPDGGAIELRTDAGVEEDWMVAKAVRTGSITVPPEGPVAFVLEHAGRRRWVPLPEGHPRTGGPPLVLPWYRPNTIRCRFTGPDGEPVPVRTELQDEIDPFLAGDRVIPPAERGTQVEVVTFEEGPRFLLVEPEDPALAGVALPVDLPAGDGSEVDLGTVRLRRAVERHRVFIHGRGGGWFGEPWAQVERPGGPDFALRSDDGEDGCAPAFVDLREGDSIVLPDAWIEGAWAPPRRVRLRGPGPWTIPWPTASLNILPEDEGGAVIPGGSILLDGGGTRWRDSSLRIVGLEAGPHRIYVTAPGFAPLEIRGVLAEGERRDLAPRLRRLP